MYEQMGSFHREAAVKKNGIPDLIFWTDEMWFKVHDPPTLEPQTSIETTTTTHRLYLLFFYRSIPPVLYVVLVTQNE